MRINKYIAQATGISRRAADSAIAQGRVRVNGEAATPGTQVEPQDTIRLDGDTLTVSTRTQTILLNKPPGYVCSRAGQGSRTIYDLLPAALHSLKLVGRLDKDSSGLLLLTTDGVLANQLTHPRYTKRKIYEVTLDQPLRTADRTQITTAGIDIGDDRPSSFTLTPSDTAGNRWRAVLTEGRNRQIRRTFDVLGYRVTQLHRTQFGPYALTNLTSGQYRTVQDTNAP